MAIKLELSTFNLNHLIVRLKLDWGLWSLSQVPPEHLATLASCVMGSVGIMNVSGCDLVTILDSLKCEFLVIDSQESEEGGDPGPGAGYGVRCREGGVAR